MDFIILGFGQEALNVQKFPTKVNGGKYLSIFHDS